MTEEQRKLLAEIKAALRKTRYASATTGYDRNLAPHQLEAVMGTLEQVIGGYMVQKGTVAWE